MYRVNYGDGEVSQSFRLLTDAVAHINGLVGLDFAEIQMYAGRGAWTVVS